jgi:voltage-gated potassium channel
MSEAGPRSAPILFGRDRGMVFFLGFLVLTTIVLPVVTLSEAGRLALSLAFALTLIFGAFTTIHHRAAIYLVVGLTASTFAVDLFVEIGKSQNLAALDTLLRVACLSIMFCVTLKRTLRPGRINGFRVLGGIAGYLLIGLTWTFAYQLLVQQAPSAIYFDPGVSESLPGQPSHLIYFSFMTLTTVGFGDVHPVTPVARALTVAEALVGQLYIAILIASLVGMALQARSEEEAQSAVEADRPRKAPPDPTEDAAKCSRTMKGVVLHARYPNWPNNQEHIEEP